MPGEWQKVDSKPWPYLRLYKYQGSYITLMNGHEQGYLHLKDIATSGCLCVCPFTIITVPVAKENLSCGHKYLQSF